MGYWKKIFVFVAGVSLLASSFPGFATPKKALALIVHDPISNATNIKTSIESTVSAVAETEGLAQNLFEWAQSFVLSTLKRRILDVMVDQVVTWIQGGGEPKFITDWETFLGDIGQGAVGEFVEKIGAGFLCEPFSLQVRIGLLPVQRFANNAPFSCTLDQIVQNVENFYEDFRNGGWIAYNAASELPNNYYGALLIAWDARNNYVADKLAAAANNALANKGFLGTKRCYDADTGAEVAPDAAGGQYQFADGGTGRTQEFTTRGGLAGKVSGQRRRTVRCEDTTPGGIVSSALEKAVGTDFDFIINAQQLGDYAAAIVNALVNRLIMEGVNGLRGVHSGSGATYQPSQTSGTTYGGFQSTTNIPAGTRTAISSYAGTRGGATGLSRTELIARLGSALTRRTTAAAQFASALELATSYLTLTEDTLSCHATVPSLRSGGIHDAIVNKNTEASNDADLVRLPSANNLEAIDELVQTIDQLNNLTDAQYQARVNEFQIAVINSEPSLVNLQTSQASALLQQMQTLITSATIIDTQRDLDYCISQGGIAPNRGTNGEVAVSQLFQDILRGREVLWIGRRFITPDNTERVIRQIVGRRTSPLSSVIIVETRRPTDAIARTEQMTLQQLQDLAKAGGLRMLRS